MGKTYFSNVENAHNFSSKIGGDVETVFGKTIVHSRKKQTNVVEEVEEQQGFDYYEFLEKEIQDSIDVEY